MNNLLSLLPHRGPMALLDEVLHVDLTTFRTRVTLRPDFLFLKEGRVSTLIAIELFAQSAAVYFANLIKDQAAPMGGGALLGTRKISLYVDDYQVGDVLEIAGKQIWASGGLAQFECQLYRGDELCAEGSINVAAGAPPS